MKRRMPWLWTVLALLSVTAAVLAGGGLVTVAQAFAAGFFMLFAAAGFVENRHLRREVRTQAALGEMAAWQQLRIRAQRAASTNPLAGLPDWWQPIGDNVAVSRIPQWVIEAEHEQFGSIPAIKPLGLDKDHCLRCRDVHDRGMADHYTPPAVVDVDGSYATPALEPVGTAATRPGPCAVCGAWFRGCGHPEEPR